MRPQPTGSDVTATATPQTVFGTVDPEGRLIAADGPLRLLHRQAGGEEGGALAIPQLAALARLSASLGVQLSRSIIAADGDTDLNLTVQARPDGEMVHLAIDGWHRRSLPTAAPAALSGERAQYYAKVENEGSWECDAALRICELALPLARLANLRVADMQDQPLTRLFRLLEDDAGDLPILTALAKRSAFIGQCVELRANPEIRLWLSGEAKQGTDGQFAGYAGGYAFVEPQHAALHAKAAYEVERVEAVPFAEQLDAALRQPIARIIANADQISARSNGPIRQDYASYANDISAAGRHLLGLINDISDMQAVEQQDFLDGMETVDLADLTRRAAGLLKVRAADQSVRIDAPPLDEAIEAKGDFRRVLQIIVNLLSNAVRYSPRGSSIWIRTEIEGDLAAVIVADQGKGIAVADQARIFEKFERLDPSEPGGTGLGLYISRRLARAMGGDINVDSAPGQGSRFVLTLPLA